MAQTKRYPFSLRKHAHDLEFRRNRALNEWFDTEDEQKKDRRQPLIDALANILLYCPDYKGIIWITGKEYGLANESVQWAESNRGIAHI